MHQLIMMQCSRLMSCFMARALLPHQYHLLLFLFQLIIFLFQCPLLISASFLHSSSSLDLSQGLNLSMHRAYNFTSDGNGYIYPNISLDLPFTLGIPTVDAGGLFLPLLSSPSFNRTHSSQKSGFSLGFYFVPVISNFKDNQFFAPCESNGCNIYMAVCAGLSGYINYTDNKYLNQVSLAGATDPIDPNIRFLPYQSSDGFVVPVWTANLDKPIRFANRASLVAMPVADSKGSNINYMELQLKNGDDVLWRVSNAGMMEMQDTGDLLVYDSPRRSKVVWQNSGRDTLVHGQNLTEGMELRSNDSSYIARVEKGGLVLYLNSIFRFNMESQPSPYWIFPLSRLYYANSDLQRNSNSLNQLVHSAPCSNSSAYILFDVITNRSLQLRDSMSCAAKTDVVIRNDNVPAHVSWGFLRLENDGRIYIYAVAIPIGDLASATRFALDSEATTEIVSVDDVSFSDSTVMPSDHWGQCDVPMACGPAGVCTPGANTPCSCPDSFQSKQRTDLSQGCERNTPLPLCSEGISGKDQHSTSASTDFLQLNSTASIFLFNRWTFNITIQGHVDDCKHKCLADCSCHGFIYQVDTSACFFIAEEISLLHVDNKNLTFLDYSVSISPYYNAEEEVHQEILAGNYATYLKVLPSLDHTSTVAGNKKVAKAMLMAIILPSTVAACLVLGLAVHFLTTWKRKRAQRIMRAQEEKELQDIMPLLPNRFSYKDLHEATKGFSKLLGEGGCGSVYAGVFSDRRRVAVKVLKVVLQGADQSKQFLAEVATVGRTSHHNIVRLLGFCWENSHRLLVYEYVERGALDRWLFAGESMVDESTVADVEAARLLDWNTRYNVAIGIARGLNYLHEECEQPILHFDIKPQNILLDDAFVAKLADFGMSRLMQRDISSVVTGVRGTPGYIAPEWFSHGTVSKKNDVYSMGMVMLEIVGGRKIWDIALLNKTGDSMDKDAWHLPSWAAKKFQQGLMMELVDKRLYVRGFDSAQAQRLIYTALWCINENPAMRPNAPTVLQWLEGTCAIEEPPFSFAH